MSWFVWGTWLAALTIAVSAVALYGRNLPFAEDWFLVPPLTGNEPSLLAWIWTPNSEHLVPFPKLVYLLLLKVAGGDFRVGMFFNALLLGALAYGMILMARHLRGGEIKLTDAFFPIVLLHLGHWDNLLWSWQITFVLSTVLTCALLLMVVGWKDGPPTPASAAAAALCVLFLALSGGSGMLVAPAFAVWMLVSGVLRLRGAPSDAASSRSGPILIASAVLTLVLVGAYLIGYERPEWYPASSSLLVTAETTMKFVAFGFGPGARKAWMLASIGALAVLLLTGALLVSGALSARAAERCRVLGLVLVVASLAALALAMGVGRGGKVEASGYMSTRYALLSVPMLCAAYFIVELYGSGAWNKIGRTALFGVAIVLLPLNTLVGLERRDWFERGFTAVETDLRENVAIDQLADRHYPFLMPWNRDALASGMRMLHDDCRGPLGRLQNVAFPPPGNRSCSGIR